MDFLRRFDGSAGAEDVVEVGLVGVEVGHPGEVGVESGQTGVRVCASVEVDGILGVRFYKGFEVVVVVD